MNGLGLSGSYLCSIDSALPLNIIYIIAASFQRQGAYLVG